nr:CMF_HP1_G0046200.mRNA.1.CDS.1 [Saccharomyces cerevisiae]
MQSMNVQPRVLAVGGEQFFSQRQASEQHQQQNMGPQVYSPQVNRARMFPQGMPSNLYSEFAVIRQLVSQYNHVSISTEFVGTLARPIGTFRSKVDYHYQTMRANVDFLNPIQLGLSLSDANGNKPDNGPSTWQFNFEFDPKKEIMSTESLELLRKSGINFEKHENSGIDVFEFSQLLMDSGLMMDDSVTWITYHAAYDLGFLINILMNDSMPNNKEDF